MALLFNNTGVHISGTTGALSENIRFTNVTSTSNNYGFYSEEIDCFYMEDCRAVDGSQAGFKLHNGTKNVMFRRCFACNNAYGFDITSQNRDTSGLIFEDCVGQSNTSAGLRIDESGNGSTEDISVVNCIFNKNAKGIDLADGGEINVTRTLVADNTGDGVSLHNQCRYGTVSQCVFTNNGGWGVDDGGSDIAFCSNVARNNTLGNYSGVSSVSTNQATAGYWQNFSV